MIVEFLVCVKDRVRFGSRVSYGRFKGSFLVFSLYNGKFVLLELEEKFEVLECVIYG